MAIKETFASNIFEFDYKSPPTGAELIEFIKKHHLENHQIVAEIPFYSGPHEDGIYYYSECDKLIVCHSEYDDDDWEE